MERNLYTPLLSLSTLLLLIIGCACVSDDKVVTTRLTAEIDGILVNEGGCLRVKGSDSYSRAPVWHKEIFKTERRGDAVLIVELSPNGQPSPAVIWRLGDMIRGGGGATSSEGADDHAGAGFSERCAGPYFVVHSVG